MISKPRDTTKDIDSIALLAMCIGTGAIEHQERQGQREAVASESLPTPREGDVRAQYEALGFVFGEAFADDPLFCPVTMPPGWTKRRTDHSMHNDIVDAAGNKRGSFFYKAAFYDRDAILYAPNRRYNVRQRYPERDDGVDFYERSKMIVVQVEDSATGSVLHVVTRDVQAPIPNEVERRGGLVHRAWWDEQRVMEKDAFADASTWLAKHFPDHANPGAYWPE